MQYLVVLKLLRLYVAEFLYYFLFCIYFCTIFPACPKTPIKPQNPIKPKKPTGLGFFKKKSAFFEPCSHWYPAVTKLLDLR